MDEGCWLRNYVTSQKFAVGTRHEATELSIVLMALGSTQHLTEINTKSLPRRKGQMAHNNENLSVICEQIV
jgi:hypothetical protein